MFSYKEQMRLIGLMLIFAFGRAVDPPWPISSCPHANSTCRRETENQCRAVCINKACNIIVGVILPNDTNYIINLPTVSLFKFVPNIFFGEVTQF